MYLDAITRSLAEFSKKFKDAYYNAVRQNPRKATYMRYEAPPYPTLEEFEDLYRSSWLIQKACDKIPTDSIKNWIEIKSENENDIQTLNKWFKKLNLKQKLMEAGGKMNIFGGAWVLIGAKDGQTLDMPLDIKKITDITALTVLSSDELTPIAWTDSKESPNYGMPEMWRDSSSQQTIHYSRLLFITMPTINEDHRQERNGLGDSKIYGILEAFKTFGIINSGVEDIFLDFATKIVTIQDMMDKLMSDEGKRDLMNRFAYMNATLSNDALLILGDKEKFEKISHNTSGLKDLIVFALDVFSGASGVPKTKLFGQQLGVLAGAQETAEDYYIECESFREKFFQTQIDYMLQCICSAANINYDNISWDFRPIKTPTMIEEIDMQTKATDSAIKLYQAYLIDQEEARQVISANAETWLINVDPNKKIQAPEVPTANQ